MQISEINKLIADSELPSILDPNILSKLAKICTIKKYKKDMKIYSRGKKVTNFLMLITGECELVDSNKINK